MNKIFISVNKDIEIPNAIVLQNEIGILEEELEDYCLIHFVIRVKIISLSRSDFTIFDVQKTGDEFPKKVCNVCHRLLPTDQFDKNQNGRNNRTVRRPSCSECRKIIDGVSVPASEKRKWEKSKPKLEPFKCPICEKITIPSLTSKVVLDHDHSKLLCI